MMCALLLGAGAGCGGGGSSADTSQISSSQPVGQIAAEAILLTPAQMASLGFSYGPFDGTTGAINNAGTYTFFGSGYKTSGGVQGAYSFTGNLTSITGSPLTALITSGNDPNRYVFDVNYAGGGPVIPLFAGITPVGYLMAYHGEYQCIASNGCSNANSRNGFPNFYSSLGLAFSSNLSSPYSFKKMGQVVEPYTSHDAIFSKNNNMEIGGGAMMIADANGTYITNFAALSDKSSAYIYVFFSDIDPTNTVAPCSSSQHCIGLARASYTAVVAAATSNNHAVFPTLFHKYYKGGFTESATSSNANNGPNTTANAGHFTAVVADSSPLYPSVIYVTKINKFLLTYTTGNNQINFQTGNSLLNWSGNITAMQITLSGSNLLYPSLLGETSDVLTSSGSPYLHYLKSNALTGNFWSNANYVSRSISF